MQRALLGQLAAVQVKGFNRKFRGLEKGVAGEKLLQAPDRAIFQAGQG